MADAPQARQCPVACVDGQGVVQNEAARVHVAVAQAARAARVLATVQHPAHDVPYRLPAIQSLAASGQQDDAKFLISYSEFGGGLSNQQFTILVKARLGLQTVDDCECDMPCPACSNRRAPHGKFYNQDSTLMRPDGLHVHSCRDTGNGGASGRTAARHEHVKFTVIAVIKKYKSKTNITTDIKKEPILEDLFPPKVSSGGNVPIRWDILLYSGGV